MCSLIIMSQLSKIDYCIVGMFRGVKVSFLKEKMIFVGFISVLLSRSISNTVPV